MRQNEFVAVSTDKVLLVPYDRRHVLTYHAWMEDPAIQQATASEPLTLEEEYENQESWRASHDKMTFIVCQPLDRKDPSSFSSDEDEYGGGRTVQSGAVDTPDKMIGDINLFLSPYDEEEDDDEDDSAKSIGGGGGYYIGEVDIMIASTKDQGKGTGKAAVLAFLGYLARHSDEILGEYTSSLSLLSLSLSSTSESNSNDVTRNGGDAVEVDNNNNNNTKKKPKLHSLMAKISQTNVRSIALFRGLGFEQQGEVNFFGEVKLVLPEREFTRRFGAAAAAVDSITPGYEELVYVRTGEDTDGKP